MEGSREKDVPQALRVAAQLVNENSFTRLSVEQPYFNLEARKHNGFQLR
jgi:hypothetical protein